MSLEDFNFQTKNQALTVIEVDSNDKGKDYVFVFDTPPEKQKILSYQVWKDAIPNTNSNRSVFSSSQEEWITNVLNSNDTIHFEPTTIMNSNFIFVIKKFRYSKELNQMIWIVSTKDINILNETDVSKNIPEGKYTEAFFEIDSFKTCIANEGIPVLDHPLDSNIELITTLYIPGKGFEVLPNVFVEEGTFISRNHNKR